MNTIEVAELDLRKGGGAYRAYKMLMNRSSTGIKCHSVLMSSTEQTLRDIISLCPPLGSASLKRPFNKDPNHSLSAHFLSVLSKSLPSRLSIDLRPRGEIKRADAVICHHEDIVCLKTALEISKRTGSKSVAILQSPPFYKDAERLSKIVDSILLFNRLRTIASSSLTDLVTFTYNLTYNRVKHNKVFPIAFSMLENILRRFDLVLAVSRSIPVEMGWEGRVVAMDPGVGFDEEELSYIKSLKIKKPDEPRLHAVFPARPVPEKGLADVLIATRIIARSRRDFKIAIAASERDPMGALIAKIAKKLGIIDNLVLTGYIPKRDYLNFRAGAKLSLYPSHIDSYSYAVAESLLLGTPVVGYDIPALRINYGDLNGIYLVKEGDIEALAQKVLEILDARVDVEEPRVKLFSEVALEEKKILEKYL